MAEKPKETAYKSAYSSAIDDLVNKAINREPFSYDPATDAAYQSYARQYTRLGNEAARDTLADVSAQTGGLASSYATTAAQQARGAYNQALTDKIPSLMEAAYNKYRNEYSDMLAGISTLQGLDDSMYNRYANDRAYNRSIFESDRAYDEDVRRYNQDYARSIFESDRAYDEDVRRYNQDYARSIFESDRAYDEQVRQFNKEFGLSEAQFNEAVRQYNQNFARDVFESDRDYEQAERQFEKQFGLSVQEFEESVRQFNQNYDYQQQRDAVADQQWNEEFNEKVREYDQNYALDKDATKFEQMLNTWTTLGYATKEIAKYFGVKEGTKTNEAAYQAAQLALDKQALAKSGRSGRSGGSGRYYRRGSTYQSSEQKYGPFVVAKDGTKETSASGLELDLYKDSPYNVALDVASRKLLNGATKEQVVNYLNTVKGLSDKDIDRLKQALGLGGNEKDYHTYKDPYTGTVNTYNF